MEPGKQGIGGYDPFNLGPDAKEIEAEIDRAVGEDERDDITVDSDLQVRVRDHWDMLRHNPLGRSDFAPPRGHDKIDAESCMRDVVSLYGADIKRLFKSYTNIEGHKSHSRVSKGTFDDLQKNNRRLDTAAIIKMLRDFRLIAKQSHDRTKFLHTADIAWIKRGLVPCVGSFGHLPVSVDEVKRIIQKWRRRPMRNGLKEVQYILEDIDMGGFIQVLSRVVLLGFRRLIPLQCNLDREAWSSAARRAFRRCVPPPNLRNANQVGIRAVPDQDTMFWSLGSCKARAFRRINKTSLTWRSTIQRRRLQRSDGRMIRPGLDKEGNEVAAGDVVQEPSLLDSSWEDDGRAIVCNESLINESSASREENELPNEKDPGKSIWVSSPYDLIVGKVTKSLPYSSEVERNLTVIASACNPYRDTDAMCRVVANRHDQYRVIFDLIDADASGIIDRKELMDTVQSDNFATDLVEDVPALAPLMDVENFNAFFDRIDTDHDGSLTFDEFCAFLESFDQTKKESQSNEVREKRYRRHVSRSKNIDSVFRMLERTGKPSMAYGRVARDQLLAAMTDPVKVSKMLDASDAMSVLCDPDTFDDVLDMLGVGPTGINKEELLRFCNAYDSIMENITLALGGDIDKDSVKGATSANASEKSDHDAELMDIPKLARRCFAMRVKMIARIHRAFELFRPSSQVLLPVYRQQTVRGLNRSSLLKMTLSRIHKKDIIANAPALRSLFKPKHFSWCFRMMSAMSFGENNSNPNIITWDGFRDFCLSYEHRLAKQPRLPLKNKGDLLRIEHILVDGIWLRPSSINGEVVFPRFPERIMCRGEMISQNGKLCTAPLPRGIFPLDSLTIVHLERLSFDEDLAASLIQAMIRGYMLRLRRDKIWPSVVKIQKIIRGFLLRQKVASGHRARARVAKAEVGAAIRECPSWVVLESIFIRMGMCFSRRSTMHKKLMARTRAFTFAQGENPVRHHPKFNHVAHVKYTPKYQHQRQFFVNEGLSVVDFVRMLIRESQGSEEATRALIKQHGWNRDGYMLYEDVYNCFEHILAGNKDGGVISRTEMANEVFPLIDPKQTGMIDMEVLIDLIYAHEANRKPDAMLATKALGSKDRQKPKCVDPHTQKITKAEGHRASLVWSEQLVPIDSLELSKIYGRDVWDSEEERQLVVYLLDHYTYGLTFLFDWYCAIQNKSEAKTNKLLFHDLGSHDQITLRKALKMAKDLRLTSTRAKIEHFEKSKQNPKVYKPLPEGTFTQFAWIDSMDKDVNSKSEDSSSNNAADVPRLTRTGCLPVSPQEVKKCFALRTRHAMQWRKMDIAAGLTSISSIALFLMDIAEIACSRMEVTQALFEREKQSGEAVKSYFDAIGGAQAMTGGSAGSSEVAERVGKAAQIRTARRRCKSMISNLTKKQKVEAVLLHVNLGSTDQNTLKRQILMSAEFAFKFPVGSGIPAISKGKMALRSGRYVPKKVFNQNLIYRIDPELKGKDIAEFIKRSVINLCVESGKSYRTIFQQFDSNRNGTLEPNEIWEWFSRLAPDGLLSTMDFRKKILSQLYGLDPNEPYTPECVARLHLPFADFEKWIKSAKVSVMLCINILLFKII